MKAATPQTVGDVCTKDAYAVHGRYTAVRVVLRMGLLALDLIRSGGDRLGPVQVCHTHRLVHILVDADQAARFEGLPGVLAAADDSADCGHHRAAHTALYWIVPAGGDSERVDPDVLRTILINHYMRGNL